MNNPDQINLHGVRFPRTWLFQHTMVSGGTGAGKTRGILRPLIRQIIAAESQHSERRAAMFVFDIKGDLKPILEAALTESGREEDLIVVGIAPDEATFNPLGDPTLTPTQITQLLTQAASTTGQAQTQRTRAEDLFWSTARADLLTSLVELAQNILREEGHRQLSLEHLQRTRGLLSQSTEKLKAWVAAVAPKLSEVSGNALMEWVHLPSETTRACVTSSVGSVLSPWSREPLCRLVTPDPQRRQLDLREVVDQGKIVVINVAQAEHADELWPGTMLLKQNLFRLALTRARLNINQKRMIAIVIDEATRLLSGHNDLSSEHVAMEMARSNNVAFVLALQNLSALDAMGGSDAVTSKLAALCTNQIFLANNCPATWRLAQRCFGNHVINRRHRTMVPAIPPPQLFPTDEPEEREADQIMLVPVEVPVISPETLSRLPAGAAHAKLADGSIHTFQCSFD